MGLPCVYCERVFVYNLNELHGSEVEIQENNVHNNTLVFDCTLYYQIISCYSSDCEGYCQYKEYFMSFNMLSGVQFPAEARDFTFLTKEHTSSRTQLASYSVGSEVDFAGTTVEGT
jgi:hypothetical protein